MSRLLPIYHDKSSVYRADTCEPVKAAAKSGEIEHVALSRGAYPGRQLVNGELEGVLALGYWDAAHDQDWGLPWHRNEGIEITFLETGRLSFAVDGWKGELRPDDLTLTRPWQPHRVGDANVTAGRLHFLILDVGVRHPHTPWTWPHWLVLTPADLDRLTTNLRQNEQPVWHAGSGVRNCFRRIAEAVKSDDGGSRISRLTVYLNELFILLLDVFRDSPAALNESLTSSVRTVEFFLADLRQNREDVSLEWSVAKMARHCGLGVTHFTHHVKQLTNLTPIEYLNRCRVETACRMLLDKPDIAVTRVSLACGFSTSQYFAAVFRRNMGCTPREFRCEKLRLGHCPDC